MLAEQWWFWAVVAILAVIGALSSRAYRRRAIGLRRWAVARGLLDPGAGRRIDSSLGGFWSDPSWLLVLVGSWVALSPWIWGYDDAPHAVAVDLSGGGAIALLALAGVLLPAVMSIELVLGSWLALAPWIVGYGSAGGPVGLSDLLAGLVTIALSITTMAAAARRMRPAEAGAVARVRRDHN